ncbi:MAG: ParB/RepB/Spo0J family partition protein [Phycisphaerales bacterium]|nr:ParB/RepB/Spo0J family partition protein [Phycisphaerales bacterium]
MADSKRSTPRKSDATASSGSTGNTSDKASTKPKKRRLGRGLGSLLSVPVDVDSGVPRGTEESGRKATRRAASKVGAVAEAVRGLAGGREGDQKDEVPASAGVNEEASGDSELTQVQLLEVSLIQPNRHQPRTEFDEEALQELAQSIGQSGLMQPIVVRSTGNSGELPWELVAGERRLRAIKILDRTVVPALVIEADDRASAELALIENLQREDLNPLDRAAALANLRDTFGLNQGELAERVGLDRSSVANLLRVLELDDFCAAAVRRGTLSLGHAKALLAISDDVLRRTTAAASLNAGWSVRELERRIRHLQGGAEGRSGGGKDRPITSKQANVVDLERRLGEILGMRVNITLGRKKGCGKLQVEFNSLEQFDTLTDLLGLGPGEPS